MWIQLLCVCLLHTAANALDNGLALTPPMGWLSWVRFICNTDCKNDPYNCISERLYMDMADRLASDGFREVGYKFVNIDDCWMAKTRDDKGKLQADPERFPHGIKYIADYVHSKGLKLGIYQDSGNKTCAGYPGSDGYFNVDAQTFADWGIDMLKVDGCYAEPSQMDILYPLYGSALNQTGRPIVYSCSWPAYQTKSPDYNQIAETCNLWRNYDDIEDSWTSVLSIIDFYAANQDEFAAVAGPGQWNDPDMIIGGNSGLSYEEAKAQFAIWAVMASPLLMSNDLRSLDPQMKKMLTNKEVISVNQDELGIMGKRIYSNNSIEIWSRRISPVTEDNKYSYALVILNRRTLGGPVKVSLQLKSLGLDSESCYILREPFLKFNFGRYCPADTIALNVITSGVRMVIAKTVLF